MGRGIEENERFYRAIFREIAKIRLGLDEGGAGQERAAASSACCSSSPEARRAAR